METPEMPPSLWTGGEVRIGKTTFTPSQGGEIHWGNVTVKPAAPQSVKQIATRELLAEVLANRWSVHRSVAEAYLKDIESLGWLKSDEREGQ